jgi:hypothetical protein
METAKRRPLRWLIALIVGGALLGATVVYAQKRECWACPACGCSPDGGTIYCCEVYSC